MNAKQITGNVGLFYVCYRLSLLGWNAMPTIRNARGADIILVNGGEKLGIQVKTLSNEADVPLGSNYSDLSVNFWIILMNVRRFDRQRVYIIPQADIMNGVKVCEEGSNSSLNLIYHDNPKANGKITYWINKKFLVNLEHGYSEAWQSIM